MNIFWYARIRNYITQSGVLQPKASSWVHLFQDDDDRNFSYNSWLCQTNFLLLQAILIPEIEIDTRDYLYSLKMRMEWSTRNLLVFLYPQKFISLEVIDKRLLEVVLVLKYPQSSAWSIRRVKGWVEILSFSSVQNPAVHNCFWAHSSTPMFD
jgi:hypothetical protein